ncbi:hypothetical protein [Pseudomonas citri]|uniref:hypothetical protein n=1 Tax=Pseudomonas citri TaxID=2978349 RepID=UPI0021B635AF|nr:hypothetical protein [Pseudomonas citri]
MNALVQLPTTVRAVTSFPFDVYGYRLHAVEKPVGLKAGIVPAGIGYMPWVIRMLKMADDLQRLTVREEMARSEYQRFGRWPADLVGTWRWGEKNAS